MLASTNFFIIIMIAIIIINIIRKKMKKIKISVSLALLMSSPVVFAEDMKAIEVVNYNVPLCQDHLNQHSYFTYYATSGNFLFSNPKLLIKVL